MFGPKYVWFLFSGRNQDNWWKVKSPLVDCTPEQVRKGLSNNIGTGELKLSPLPGTTIYGKVSVQEMESARYRFHWSSGRSGRGGGWVEVGSRPFSSPTMYFRLPLFPGFLFLTIKHYCVIPLYFSRFPHFLYSYLLLFPLSLPLPLRPPILPGSHPMASPQCISWYT